MALAYHGLKRNSSVKDHLTHLDLVRNQVESPGPKNGSFVGDSLSVKQGIEEVKLGTTVESFSDRFFSANTEALETDKSWGAFSGHLTWGDVSQMFAFRSNELIVVEEQSHDIDHNDHNDHNDC